MPITCFIRYDIDPHKRAQFEQYARTWGQAIPAAGADLVGYFVSHEGSATTAYGVYHVQRIAHYEAYRAPCGRFRTGARELSLRAEGTIHPPRGRLFLSCASLPHAGRNA